MPDALGFLWYKVAIFLSGFLLGLLALALAEGAALLWAVRTLRRPGPSPPPAPTPPEPAGVRPCPTHEKQVSLLVSTPCSFLSLPIFLSSLLASKNGEVAGKLNSVPCGVPAPS
jgi:hypothetical protein